MTYKSLSPVLLMIRFPALVDDVCCGKGNPRCLRTQNYLTFIHFFFVVEDTPGTDGSKTYGNQDSGCSTRKYGFSIMAASVSLIGSARRKAAGGMPSALAWLVSTNHLPATMARRGLTICPAQFLIAWPELRRNDCAWWNNECWLDRFEHANFEVSKQNAFHNCKRSNIRLDATAR